MGEPSSSTAAGIAGYKLGVGILGIGVVASALGFLVLLPKTAKEAAVRALATMIGSSLLGPVLVIGVYQQYPKLFTAGVELAGRFGFEPWAGLFVTAAPICALAGLPFWWVLGAIVLWLERRRGKDIAELAADARAGVGGVIGGRP